MASQLQVLLGKIAPLLCQSTVISGSCKQRIMDCLQHYDSNPNDWQQYVYYDARHYTRNLIQDGTNYNVMTMCWTPGQSSAVHGHEGSQCFVKILSGQLTERTFTNPAHQQATEMSQRFLQTNSVTYIDDSIGIHQMINEESTEPAVSLHVYVPKYKQCRIFDDHTQLIMERSHSVAVKFQTIFGQLNNDMI